MTSEFLKFAAALFAIMNPFGNVAIFLSVTGDREASERRTIALATSTAVLVTLLVAAVLGQQILGLFGISVGSFRIAGGFIILILALALVAGVIIQSRWALLLPVASGACVAVAIAATGHGLTDTPIPCLVVVSTLVMVGGQGLRSRGRGNLVGRVN